MAYLGSLYCRPQACDLLLNSCIHLLYLQLLLTALLPHSSFLQIQIQPYPSLRARDFLPQPLLQLLNIRHEPVVLGFNHGQVILLHELQLRFYLCKVHLLSVIMLSDTFIINTKTNRSIAYAHLLLISFIDHVTRHVPDALIYNFSHRRHNTLRLCTV
jgi:hypothetical protein